MQLCRFGTVVSVNVVKVQNLIIAQETNEVDSIVSAMDEADQEYDDTKTRTELQPDLDHSVLGDICSTEPSDSHKFEEDADADVHSSYDDQINTVELSSRVCKPEDGAEAIETNSMSEDKLTDNSGKDQVHQLMQERSAKLAEESAPEEGSDILMKVSNKLHVCVDRTEIPDDPLKDTSQEEGSQVENKFSIKQEKENSILGRDSYELDYSSSKELDGRENEGKNEQEYDQGNVFEPGCVLVEFRRTEASCMAAHCLHGRLFDDRVVTVSYVDFDLYRSRFPK